MAMNNLVQEKVWCDKSSYDKAECSYFERLTKSVQGSRMSTSSDGPVSGSLANEVAKARQHIKQGLQCITTMANDSIVPHGDILSRMARIEMDNQELRTIVNHLSNSLAEVSKIVEKLSHMAVGSPAEASVLPYPTNLPAPLCVSEVVTIPSKSSVDDSEIDLFGTDSNDEDAEATKIREERLAAYAVKKSKKPMLIPKSNIVFDIKPWDDETDMEAMEREVRKIVCEGLLWGASKLVPLAYGIHKLQISCVVEDERVSVDWLTEKMEEITELVQSVDIAAFNKV